MQHILLAPVKHPAGKVLRIHTTDRTCFKQCRRKWMFSSPLQLNLERVWPDRKLFLGKLVHQDLASCYQPPEGGWLEEKMVDYDGQSSLERCRCEGLEDLEGVFQFYYKVARRKLLLALGWVLTDEQEEELEETLQLGLAMMHTYRLWAARYDDLRVIATEIPFSVPIHDYRTGKRVRGIYEGRVDNLVERGHDLWLGEVKSCAQMRTEERLQFDEQWGSYIWAVESEPIGWCHIQGVVYTELRKKIPHKPDLVYNGTRLSCNKSQDTTLDVYLEALAELEGWKGSLIELEAQVRQVDPTGDYVKMFDVLTESDARGKFVRRTWVRRSEAEIEEIGKRIFHDYREMRHPAHVCPTPTWDCTWRCDFKEVCLAMSDGVDVTDYLYGEEFQPRVGYYGDSRDEA